MTKHAGGRPTDYSEELIHEICLRLQDRSLSKVCRDDDMPSRSSVNKWLSENKEFSDNYARACRIRRENRFEDLDEVIDSEPDTQRARLKVDVIKWQLSKEEPKKYGDKLDVESRSEVTHKFKDMTDEQLDQLIQARQDRAA